MGGETATDSQELRPHFNRVVLKLGGGRCSAADRSGSILMSSHRWPARSPKSSAAASRLPSSSAAGTSSAVRSCSSGGWNAPAPITWACSAR